jgi:membrane protein implicated in regulation of membrane protease activity
MPTLDYVVGGMLIWLIATLFFASPLLVFGSWGVSFAFVLILLIFIGGFYWYYRSRLSFKPNGPLTSI